MVVEVPVTEARAEFSELINRVGYGGERVVITRHGKPLVALVPASEAMGDLSESSSTVTVLDLGSRTGSTGSRTGIAAQQATNPKARD
jgi:prevent-host-death family protein